jgi:hypothetical protein
MSVWESITLVAIMIAVFTIGVVALATFVYGRPYGARRRQLPGPNRGEPPTRARPAPTGGRRPAHDSRHAPA